MRTEGPSDAAPFQRVLLVGFMGAGKSSVGEALALRLGWSFRDFDREIERETGRSVAEIFAERGEDAFRRLEADMGGRLLSLRRVVLAPGGGWAAASGRLEGLPSGTASFWLRVSAEEAVRRAEGSSGARPLLTGDDPIGAARALLSERSTAYAAAQWTVDTDRSSVEDVTARILGILAAHGHGPSTE